MLSALDRKLFRSLSRMRGQSAAIAVVIGCGVGTFVMSVSIHHSLKTSQSLYYERTHFAEVFALLKRAPNSLMARIEEIPGVAKVETRVVRGVTLDVEGLPEPATGRLISLPRTGSQQLNKIVLRKGRLPETGRSGEAVVSEAFALANQFELNDTVKAVMNGRRETLRIVGIALSPEYITQMQEGSLFPDDRRFGVFWMGKDELEAAFNMEGAFNDVTLTLMKGASEEEVIRRLDVLIAPYGGAGAYGREHQISNRFVSDEISQLRTMAIVMPSVFFGVAAFLLNMALRRIIALEREQIAALKAFGYSNGEVGFYYLKMVFIIVCGGAIFGTFIGLQMGVFMTDLYAEFYRLPSEGMKLEPSILATAFGFSLLAATLGVWSAVQGAVKLPPAEAMRPEPPARYRAGLTGLLGRMKLISNVMRMILRELERRPLKAFFSSLGIAFAVAIVIVGTFSSDAVDFLFDYQFGMVERQDMKVTFIEPTSASSLFELQHLPGVLAAEPFRAVACRLRNGPASKRTIITGLPPDSRMYRLVDADRNIIPIPASGMVMSQKLGELLQVRAGDLVTVEILEGQRQIREVVVTGLVNDYMGTAAFMSLSDVNALMREGPAITGGHLAVDPHHEDQLYTELKLIPRVVGVVIKTAAMESFMETVAENLTKIRGVNVLFAIAIAIGVVYNNARITLSERSAELGTLRVIGFTRAEISAILLGELAVLTLVAIPMGLAIGHGLGWMMARAMDTELYRIPFMIKERTYLTAAGIVIVTSVVSGMLVRRRLDKLDLIAVLKSRT